ncbi:MAG TPA: hydantoinase/oxoprolinase family protein, partial [Chloroflexota bacterium]|nr:hydantoinase/oxoprolinase family protein [Chloroflexota bacterium]
PRDFTLVAFGGSGPIHAAAIARSLQIPRVVVPPAPGLFSAFGLLAARPEQHSVRTCLRRVDRVDAAELSREYAELERAALVAASSDGYGSRVAFTRQADLRYAGQAYELTVPWAGDPLTPADVSALVARFEEEHERTYGHRANGEPVEIVNLRVVASFDQIQPPAGQLSGAGAPTTRGERPAFFGSTHGTLSTPIVSRSELDASERPGPFIVEEYDATVVVSPDDRAWLDEFGNIVIEAMK